MDTPAAIGMRLKALRYALGFKQAKAFCGSIGVLDTAWNNGERGRRIIPLEVASKIYLRCGASLDWIYHGVEHALPVNLAEKLRLHAAESRKGDRDWLNVTLPRSPRSKCLVVGL